MKFKPCIMCGRLSAEINGSYHCFFCGRDWENQPEPTQSKSSFLYQQNEKIKAQAHKNLLNNLDGSLDYCLRRGIKMGTILDWQLGYVPDQFSLLPVNWWKRILFPIMSIDGTRIIAFGGRKTTVDDRAKYVNSPNGPTYKKGESLYGYSLVPEYAEKVYLCEGYVDVLSMDSSGFAYPVASLGTSLTSNQALLLRKKAQQIVICYDNDEAGQKSTLRAIDLLIKAGFKTSEINILLPEGAKDVDEALQHGCTLREKSLLRYLSEREEYELFVNALVNT
jgi:DNA primase